MTKESIMDKSIAIAGVATFAVAALAAWYQHPGLVWMMPVPFSLVLFAHLLRRNDDA